MGYTHYFSLKEVNQVAWNIFIEDVKILRKHLPKEIYINGCYKYKTAVFNEEEIRFNGGSIPASKRIMDGNGEYELDELAHETFYLDRKNCQEFCFCKTARKPYDLMVNGVLILAQYHFPNKFEFSSDGEKDDWINGKDFVNRVFPTIDCEKILEKI